MPRKNLPAVTTGKEAATTLTESILRFLGEVPQSTKRPSKDPELAAQEITRKAATKAAATASALAVPPGPLGWLTVVPELIAVWRIQAQMVADIAAVYGKSAGLTREHMMYCLFRHTLAQGIRDLVVRVGERIVVRRASRQAMRGVAQSVGVRMADRLLGRGISRWLPIVGALGVGTYAYYDTARVAATAMEFFEKEFVLEHDPTDE